MDAPRSLAAAVLNLQNEALELDDKIRDILTEVSNSYSSKEIKIFDARRVVEALYKDSILGARLQGSEELQSCIKELTRDIIELDLKQALRMYQFYCSGFAQENNGDEDKINLIEILDSALRGYEVFPFKEENELLLELYHEVCDVMKFITGGSEVVNVTDDQLLEDQKLEEELEEMLANLALYDEMPGYEEEIIESVGQFILMNMETLTTHWSQEMRDKFEKLELAYSVLSFYHRMASSSVVVEGMDEVKADVESDVENSFIDDAGTYYDELQEALLKRKKRAPEDSIFQEIEVKLNANRPKSDKDVEDKTASRLVKLTPISQRKIDASPEKEALLQLSLLVSALRHLPGSIEQLKLDLADMRTGPIYAQRKIKKLADKIANSDKNKLDDLDEYGWKKFQLKDVKHRLKNAKHKLCDILDCSTDKTYEQLIVLVNLLQQEIKRGECDLTRFDEKNYWNPWHEEELPAPISEKEEASEQSVTSSDDGAWNLSFSDELSNSLDASRGQKV